MRVFPQPRLTGALHLLYRQGSLHAPARHNTLEETCLADSWAPQLLGSQGIRRVDMPKRPSTCQKGCPRRHAKTRLSPSTCKKNCLRRHAKQDCLCPHAKKIVSVDMQKCSRRHARGDCLRRHAKKIVPVDMPNKIVSVDMQKRLSPSTCKKDCLRRHAKKCSRRHAKGDCLR